MRMYDLIYKKRNGEVLNEEEIKFFVSGITSGEIPDYQAAALLMAIYFQGMNDKETAILTLEMAKSGDMVDLSAIPGIKVDKHSTGGVGDKTSLIVGPIVAACGVPVAKMSGRGLGHTGGTVDKMESIPGLNTSIEEQQFFSIVRGTGLAIIGQTGNIAPADKKLYALRDVTATVDSIPLIASSIMSKKLAAGSDAILLDVKTGSGAFMKTLDDSIELAKAMVSIGEHNGRRTMALITDMDKPLGNAIGNALEIAEVVEVLHGRGPQDLLEVSLELAANMLVLANKGDLQQCREQAQAAIANGSAFAKLKAMAAAIADMGVIGTFLYGFLMRLCGAVGLHHMIYPMFWYTELGGVAVVGGQEIAGAQKIFFAQLADPGFTGMYTEGTRFFAGRFDTMIFGLPAACLAMYHCVPQNRRKLVFGLFFSAALTSFLTGITEPIEFMFLFVAPWLYVIHAFLDGLSFAIADLLSVRIGNTFSGGIIDFTLFGVLQGNEKTHWIYVIVVGVFWALLYYVLFRFLITKFNIPTPGREEGEDDEINVETKGTIAETAVRVLAALGGKENIEDCDACITRLRVAVKDIGKVDKEAIKREGATAVLEVKGGIQAIFGAKADLIKSKINDIIGED